MAKNCLLRQVLVLLLMNWSPSSYDCSIRDFKLALRSLKIHQDKYTDIPRDSESDSYSQLPKLLLSTTDTRHKESLLPIQPLKQYTIQRECESQCLEGTRETETAESNSFPDIQPGSKRDELMSQWYILKKNGKVSKKGINEVERMFKQAKRNSIPHTHSELIKTDKTTSLVHTRNKRHVFSAIDSRERISDTSSYPFSSIVFIKARGCTGYFIGPRHVLTAAHCVYNITSGRWFSDFSFYRKKSCDPDKGVRYKWVKAIIPVGYKDFKHPAYDFAMIVTRKRSPARMNFGWTDKPSGLSIIHIVGYPTDKPGKCMWESSCKIEDQWSSLLGHKCDTAGGNSGSPVYKYSKGVATAYCIHRGHIGVVDEAGQRDPRQHYNVCSLITKQRFVMFSKWISQY